MKKTDCKEYPSYKVFKRMVVIIENSPAIKRCNKKKNKNEKIFLKKDNFYDGSFDCLHPFKKDIGFSEFKKQDLIKPQNDFKKYIPDVILKINKSMIQKYYLY